MPAEKRKSIIHLPFEERYRIMAAEMNEYRENRLASMKALAELGSHPVSVVPAEGMTFEMEKYFKRVDPNSGMKADRILEFNADHPIFAKLQIAVAQDEKKAEDLVKILYTQALLMADLPVENAGEYADLVCSLIG